MDFEAPVDAWYVWIGVTLVAIGLAGVALSIQTQPAPDAAKAGNTIDTVAGNPYHSAGSYDHTAREVKIGIQRVSMRNDGGTAHTTVGYGRLTPITALEDNNRTAMLRLVRGESPDKVVATMPEYDNESELREITDWAQSKLVREGAEWQTADGTLWIRKLQLDGEYRVLIYA